MRTSLLGSPTSSNPEPPEGATRVSSHSKSHAVGTSAVGGEESGYFELDFGEGRDARCCCRVPGAEARPTTRAELEGFEHVLARIDEPEEPDASALVEGRFLDTVVPSVRWRQDLAHPVGHRRDGPLSPRSGESLAPPA